MFPLYCDGKLQETTGKIEEETYASATMPSTDPVSKIIVSNLSFLDNKMDTYPTPNTWLYVQWIVDWTHLTGYNRVTRHTKWTTIAFPDMPLLWAVTCVQLFGNQVLTF